MSDLNPDTIITFIKENVKVHITSLIVSGLIVFVKDETFKKLLGMKVPAYIKLIFLIFFLVAIVVLFCDFIEYILNRNKEEKKKTIEELKEMFQPLLMGEKINIIYDWYKTYKDDALKEYKRQLQLPIEEQSEKFNRTHTTRRCISNCFNQAWKYHEKKYISDEQLKEIIAISHVRALLEKIEPLEKQIGENYNKPMFNFFRDLYKKEIE